MAVGIANKVQQKFVEELQSQATRQGADHPTGNHGIEQGLGNQNMQQGTGQLSTQSPSIQQTTYSNQRLRPTVLAHSNRPWQLDVMKVTEIAKISSTASNRTSQGFLNHWRKSNNSMIAGCDGVYI